MTESKGGYRNEFDIENEYEQPDDSRKPGAPVTAPTVVPKPSTDAFQPRRLSTPAIYTPTLGGRRRDRRDAEDHIRALQIATQVAGAAEGYEKGLTTLIEANQQRELAEQRRTQIPAKIELENLEIGKQVLQLRDEFAAAVDAQRDEQVKRDRLRQIKSEDFEATLADRRAAKLAAQARELMAEQSRARAAETAQRKADADLHRASSEAFEKEAEAETQRRRRDQERHRRTQAADGNEDIPPDLQQPLATERTVSTAREWVDRRIAQIRRRALQEHRELTPEELEQIQQLLDAAEAGEDSIRRRGASDL